MAIGILRDQALWAGPFSITSSMKSIAVDFGRDPKDKTAFGDTCRVYLPGLKGSGISYEGMIDNGAGLQSWIFSGMGSSNKPISIPLTGVVGEAAYLTQGFVASYEPHRSPIGEVDMYSSRFEMEQELVRGFLMHNASVSATGNGTAVQAGAVASGKTMVANLHVFSASGTTPQLTVKLQSAPASNFASPTDRITFSTYDSSTGAVGSTSTVITDTWWRVQHTISGTAPVFAYAVTLGLRDNA